MFVKTTDQKVDKELATISAAIDNLGNIEQAEIDKAADCATVIAATVATQSTHIQASHKVGAILDRLRKSVA